MYTYQKQPKGVVFEDGGGRLRIQPISPLVVRVTHSGKADFADVDLNIVVPQPAYEAYQVRELADRVVVDTGRLRVEVELATGRLSYYQEDGTLLQQEPIHQQRSLLEREVFRNAFDFSVPAECTQSADGPRAHAGKYERVLDRMAYEAVLPFTFAADEAIFGLGSHEEGYGNLRGRSRLLYQQNMKIVLPFFVSTKGYGFLLNCGSLMTFHDDAEGSYIWCDCVDELDFYFIAGADYDEVIAGYRGLTGPAAMLPRWAFGYAQSKEHYHTQQELVEVVREYRRRRIPLDLIVQDWFTWDEGLWGQKSFDKSRYPDPQAMVEEVHALHAKMMISIWPIMLGDGENQREMIKAGGMLGNQANYNPFLPEARQLYWDQANRGLFCYGIDAWWCDCTEPFEKDWDGKVKPQPFQRLAMNVGEAKTYIDEGKINLYSLYHSQGIYEGQRGVTREKRVVNLTRSAYAGQHRYGAIAWSGDINATWETLRRQVPEGVNFCAAGEPYWTVDIGGFFVRRRPDKWFWAGDYDQGCQDPGYRELYTRWIQYGAFLPMMRSHGADTPREIWQFGEEGTLFYDIIARYIKFRSRMLPYLYAMAFSVSLSGYTMIRAVALDFPEDTATYNLDAQFMLGGLLVCPVTRPMYYGPRGQVLEDACKTIPVYLPAGCGWTSLWTGECLDGGQWIQADAPLETIPVFARDGAVLPLGPEVQYSGEIENPPLELHIYAGADGAFVLRDDAGDGDTLERGEYSEISLVWNDGEGVCTLSARGGRYPGMPEDREFTLVLHERGAEKRTQVRYTGQAQTILMR